MRANILPAVGFYTDANRHWSTQDCLNWLPVRAERPGTRTQYQLRQCPGLKPFVRTTETGVGRGVYNVEGKLLSVVGSNLYQISNTGVAIPRGTIPGVRRVSMAHNQHGSSNQVSIANGSAGYIYDTSATTLTKITDDGFPGAMLTFFVDGYLGYIDPQGIYWGHSDLNDGLSYNALDSYEAEGLPDRIVSGLVSHREVLIFGTDSTEPYVNSPSGDGTAPFQRASNTVIETGCAATFSPVKLGDLVVFLDQYRRVCVLNGYTAVPISTAAIDQAFGECTEAEVKQAWAFGWQDRGHIVYYITVPGRFTFGYDFTHKEWHRRATNGLPHWAVSGVVKWNGKVIAQDSRNGDLYELRWDYARDADNSELIREYSPGSLNAGRNHICVNRVSLEFGVRESESVVEFPTQPNGPSISGDPPVGTVGTAYAGFTPSVTAGDAPIVETEVVSGTPGPGLAITGYSINTGTPTKSGSYALTWRTDDANGLWDEHSSVVTIQCAPPVIGTSFTATTTLPDDYRSAYIFPKANGNIGYASAANGVAVGGTYTVGELDDSLSVVGTPESFTWQAGSVGDSRLWLRGVNETGYGISADDNSGYCELLQDGAPLGYYQPSYANYGGWWYAESFWAPEYGGLVWLTDTHLYLGVRKTGSESPGNVPGYIENTIFKFPIAVGSPTEETAFISEVGTETNPRFWMTRSRDGNIHVIEQNGNYRVFDENLAQISSAPLGVDITGLRGFGIDEDVLVLVIGTVAAGRLKIHRVSDGALLQEIADANLVGNEATRVLFTDTSIFVQARKWVGRVSYTPEVCEL